METSQRPGLIQHLMHEAKQVLLWFKEQIHVIKEEAETRKKNTNEEIETLRVEMREVNEEIKNLHELVMFIGNQFNGRRSTTACTSPKDSSILLSVVMDDTCPSTILLMILKII